MQSNPRISSDDIEPDTDTVDTDDFDTTVHLDADTGRITFHAAWAMGPDTPRGAARHSVVLALDCDTMERYADLDEGTRMRVHTMLHDSVQDMLAALPDLDDDVTLTIELTDAMLDVASRLQ
ncbi:hypothetical protein [Burkholderia sp. IMCC1007]|uniref:hypothetical protein n=1 Tax=Burkholderia sp. IMCC1007 TaxID=3004104 RepID=UPI0022B5C61B|nr:hypothetical protein [Burkholderia sp. IMCC1007]